MGWNTGVMGSAGKRGAVCPPKGSTEAAATALTVSAVVSWVSVRILRKEMRRIGKEGMVGNNVPRQDGEIFNHQRV